MEDKPNWRVLALIFVSVCAVFTIIHRLGWFYSPLPYICRELYWPEGSNRRDRVLENKNRRRLSEYPLGSGNTAFARAQVAPQIWAAAPGLEEAAHWPEVVFDVSGIEIFWKEVRIIRARSGSRMGLWILGGAEKGGRATTFIGHPGGNSGTPFQTIFIHQTAGYDLVLNVLRHRPDKRLVTFVFWPNQPKALCSGVSNL